MVVMVLMVCLRAEETAPQRYVQPTGVAHSGLGVPPPMEASQ